MRLRVGDVVMVRLAQDPKKTYMGAVTGIGLANKRGFVWEADTDQKLIVAMRLEFHADDQRHIQLPHDSIETVMSAEEWTKDAKAKHFVMGNHKSLLRLVTANYGTLEAPWVKKVDETINSDI